MGAKTSKYKTSKDVFTCGICLNICKYQVLTPCDHPFCYECIQKWINRCKFNSNENIKPHCPICRFDLDKYKLIKRKKIYENTIDIYFK